MASLEEVLVELDRVLAKTAELNGALAQAGQLASDAIALLEAVKHGAYHLEEDFNQAITYWNHVIDGTAEQTEALAAARNKVEEYLRSLRGEPATRLPATADSSAQPPSPHPPAAKTSWVDHVREQLPSYITSGIYRDADGHTDLVQSGQEADREHERINQHLKDVGVGPPIGNAAAAEHVEIKVAWRMRAGDVDNAELVVNKVVCGGVYSCSELLPFVLSPGQTLVVHDPLGCQTFRGRLAR